MSYQYIWKPFSFHLNDKSDKCHFKCLKLKSLVLPGKKSEITFQFAPKNKLERKIDEYWQFEIPSENIKEIFHFVGHVIEPKVFFNNARVNFGPLLLEGKGKESIILKNSDENSYSFAFTKKSIKGKDIKHANSLSVKPLSGIIPPNNEIKIDLNFIPKHETTYNYNLECNIDQKNEPLKLNIKGIGYKLHHSISTNLVKNISSKEPVLLDFGEVFLKEKKTMIITISNNGEFNFDFILKKKENLQGITIIPETSTGNKIIFSETK